MPSKTELLDQAAKLEERANLLYYSLLAPSMTERTMREEVAALRAAARTAS